LLAHKQLEEMPQVHVYKYKVKDLKKTLHILREAEVREYSHPHFSIHETNMEREKLA
jgi:hypothetical protein